MRFSYYSTLVLGLWLTGQCWVSGEGSYPEPSISVHPSETVALGGNVTIRCKSAGYPRMEFHLQRQLSSDFEMLRSETADHDEVVFPIVNAKQSDAGIYRCLYCYKTHTCQVWSHYSDSVNISIKGQSGQIPSDNAAEGGAWVPPSLETSDHPRAIIWAGAAAGSLLLVLLLLLLVFILYRKRRRGSTANKRTQPLPVKETNLPPLEPEAEEDPEDGVSYAELSHYSLKRQEAVKPDSVPESCVYVSVANGRTGRGQ